jgi:hypothetical protein
VPAEDAEGRKKLAGTLTSLCAEKPE